MKDNFDLKKFLKESKAIENLNPSLKAINEKEDKSLKENSLKSKIREMIIDELSEADDTLNIGVDDEGKMQSVSPKNDPNEAFNESFTTESEKLHEKKEDEEGEDQEEEYVGDDERYEFEKGKEAGEKEGKSGIEDIAADLDGTESDLMGNLMNALKIAKGMDNEKLEVQIGNTLKFFVSTYIDKEENIRESINEQFTMGQKISGFLGKAVRSIKNMNKSVDGKTISDFMKREGLDPNGFNAYSVQMMSNEQEEEGKYSLTSPKLNPRKMVNVTQYQIDAMKNLGPGKGRGFVAKQIQVNLSDNIVKMEGKEYILNFMTGKYEFTGRKRDNIDVNDLPLHTDEDTEDLKKQIEKPFSISIEDLRTRLGL